MTRTLDRFSGLFPGVVITALPILHLPGAGGDAYILPRASLVVVGACVGVGLALVTRTPSLGAMRWPLLAAAAAALLAFIFSVSWPLSLAGSYTRYESLPVRLSYLGLFASAAWLLRNRVWRELLSDGFVLAACIASIEGVLQWTAHVPFRPDGSLGNANMLAALAAMALPLALVRVLRRDTYLLAWVAAIVVLGAGLWVTTSRSGALGVLAGCLTLAVLLTRGRMVFGAALSAAAVLAAGTLAMFASPLRILNNDSPDLRLHLWRDGLRMIAARPITGWGEDSTGISFGRFVSQDYAYSFTFDRVHSGPLDLAAMQGVLGLAATGSVLVVLGVAAWRRRRDHDVAGLAAALVAYSVWVLFNFDWAPVTGVFWLLAGSLWSSVGVKPPVSQQMAKAPAWRPYAAVVVVFAAVALGILPEVADLSYRNGQWETAVRLDPLQAWYRWYYGDALLANGDVAGGLAELQRSADFGESEPDLYIELGDAQAAAGNRSAARAAYLRALQIDPYFSPAAERLSSLGPG